MYCCYCYCCCCLYYIYIKVISVISGTSAAAERIRSLTLSHLPLIAVGSNPTRVWNSSLYGRYPANSNVCVYDMNITAKTV